MNSREGPSLRATGKVDQVWVAPAPPGVDLRWMLSRDQGIVKCIAG